MNELTCNLSGNTRPQSFELAELLWTDSGIMSGISAYELICTFKKKERRRGMTDQTFSKILASEEDATTIRTVLFICTYALVFHRVIDLVILSID